MIFLSVIVFEGNIIKRACMGLVIYALSIILEFFVVFTFLPWFPKVSYSDVSISLHSLIMKNMYNIMYYLVYIIMGLIGKKQYYGKGLKKIFILSVILTISQSLMLIVLLKANAEGMKLYACSFIIVYSGILLISYQLTMEMFSQTIENQQRKNELEQKMLEKRYQFDYYKLAYAKGEELRDIRHDIRNQLQAMEHLLHSEKREDKKRVEQMFVKLSDRVSDFF